VRLNFGLTFARKEEDTIMDDKMHCPLAFSITRLDE
jgi:hypothetical protein